MNYRRLKATLVLVVIGMIAVMMQSGRAATAYASDLATVSAETNIADIPNAFSYQGTLRKANGDLANGTFNITLNIYDAVTGGTALHSETFNNVVVRNGNFSVVVGDATALPADLFDNANLYVGLTVAPDADVKIFVTASAEVRARRRTDELRAKGREVDFARILDEIRGRDARDAGRATAPLLAAHDAVILDTSTLDADQVFAAAVAIIETARRGPPVSPDSVLG